MRTITTHHTNDANKSITLEADDRNENGVTQNYVARWYERDESGMEVEIPFQYGPIKEVGTNGVTLELLLTICIDQLEGYQSSKFANGYNAVALTHAQVALAALEARTKEREARGVEGTHTV